MSQRTRLLMVGLLTAALAGCGNGLKKVNVTGTVLFEGQPVEFGVITFVPAEADTRGQTAGGEIHDGKYSVADVTPGKNRVEVAYAPPRQAPASYEQYQQRQAEAMKAAMTRAGAQKMKQERDAQKKISRGSLGNYQVVDISPEGQSLDLRLQRAEEIK